MPLPHSLRAFRHRDYRLYFAGQGISQTGTWLQMIATSWLIYHLSGSAFMLGLATFMLHIPLLVLGPFAGVWVDRQQEAQGARSSPRASRSRSRWRCWRWSPSATSQVWHLVARQPGARPGQRLRFARAPVAAGGTGRRQRGPAQRHRLQLRADERRALHRPDDRRRGDRRLRRGLGLRPEQPDARRGDRGAAADPRAAAMPTEKTDAQAGARSSPRASATPTASCPRAARCC